MTSSNIVQKLWNYCNVLRDDGMSYGDYADQVTNSAFLKASEVERRLSVIEELAAAVEANLTRADRLRQAVLNKAFEGTLITGL